MSKCQINGNVMPRLIYIFILSISTLVNPCSEEGLVEPYLVTTQIHLRKSEDSIGLLRLIEEMVKIGGVSVTGPYFLLFREKRVKRIF